MGIYGSWAGGTNTSASDLDSWARASVPGREPEIRRRAEGFLKGVQVNLVLLDGEKVRRLWEKEPVFYSALFYSYLIGGEDHFRHTAVTNQAAFYSYLIGGEGVGLIWKGA